MNAETPSVATIRARPSVSHRRWRILVADDDIGTRHLLCTLLMRPGYEVDAAADGEQAWKALLSNCYDLLLTDHNMPKLTGLELVARMRAAGLRLPVIINSGCADLGVAAVLHKPLGLAELTDAVNHILPPPSEEAAIQNRAPVVTDVVPQPAVRLLPPPRQPAMLKPEPFLK